MALPTRNRIARHIMSAAMALGMLAASTGPAAAGGTPGSSIDCANATFDRTTSATYFTGSWSGIRTGAVTQVAVGWFDTTNTVSGGSMNLGQNSTVAMDNKWWQTGRTSGAARLNTQLSNTGGNSVSAGDTVRLRMVVFYARVSITADCYKTA